MKKTIRLSAILLILVLLVSGMPVAVAESQVIHTTVSGFAVNEHFADGKMPLWGRMDAPLLYSSGAQKAVVFEADEAKVSAAIRQGMVERDETITVHYQADYAFPDNEQAINDAAYAVAKELFDGALAETDQPTEGDSLRFCYYYWSYGGELSMYADKTELTLIFNLSYFTNSAQEKELDTEVDRVIDSFGFTADTPELRKIEVIYDYITENVRYDYTNLEDENYHLKYSAYAALINKTAVCEGYAVLFYRLAEECGLDARVISGLGGDPAEAHGWNIVRLGENYYYLDSTWDEGQASYSYFLKGTTDFPLHVNDAEYCTAEFTAAYPIPKTGYQFTSDPEGTEYTSGDFKYVLNGGSAVITDYIGQEAEVVVPAVLDGYTVRSIGQNAFYGNDNIRILTISEGIRSLSLQAISYCNELSELHLPASLSIPDALSSGLTALPTDCPKLATVTVAADSTHLKIIDGVLYTYDTSTLLLCPPANGKTKLTVPDGVTIIGNSAFADHLTLKEVVMPDSVKIIGYFAFAAAYNLQRADIPAKCEEICQYVFNETAVTALHLPASVKKIHPYAFDFCDLLSISVDENNPVFKVENGILHDGERVMACAISTVGTVTVPEGITSLENGAFRNASKITAVQLPSTLQTIGQSAFFGCSALTHLELPDSVIKIDNLAFGECEMLVSIIIPDSATEFGEFLFHPYKHVTIYGGEIAQRISWTVPATYLPLTSFVCTNGHDLRETVTEDSDYLRRHHYQCSRCGGKTSEYTHLYPQLSEAELTLSFTEVTYTGQPVAPEIVSVIYNGKTLTENIDFTAQIPTTISEAGTHFVIIRGIGDYRGFKTAEYKIKHADISTAMIDMPESQFVYEGNAICPEFTVKWNGKELRRYEDYGFTYENNNKEGTATLVVTGNQNFTGELRRDFIIGEHDHKFEDEALDDSYHQGKCICGRTTPAEKHDYDNDCDYYCNDCYYYRVVEHSWSETWNGDPNNHFRRCTVCGEVTDFGKHSGGQATCTSAPVCDICHLAYGDPLPHEWDMSTFKSDPTYHYNPCKNCSAGENHAKHSGGQATCTSPAECAVCGSVYGKTKSHDYSGAVAEITASGHKISCTACSALSATRSHTYKNAVCTVCGYKTVTPKPANPFTDVKSSDYFSAPVLWAVEKGVTSGTSKTTFAPNDFCTRAQVVTFLWRAAGSPKAKGGANPFIDVKKGQYYYNAVLWAVSEGITSGVSATRFAPEDTCTRGQIVAFLYRFAGQPRATGNNPFTDVKSSQYYYKAVLWAVKNGITTGVSADRFAPNETCTRAQVVTFLYRHVC